MSNFQEDALLSDCLSQEQTNSIHTAGTPLRYIYDGKYIAYRNGNPPSIGERVVFSYEEIDGRWIEEGYNEVIFEIFKVEPEEDGYLVILDVAV
jgi:hypothetical protein